MNRKEFLQGLGMSGAAIFATYCLGLSGCSSKSNDPTPASNVDFTLNLNEPANAALRTNGGFVINTSQKVIVARTNTGSFVAATIVCSHEGKEQIYYNANEFQCAAHGARFDTTGKGLNANGSKGLKIYKTTYDAAANTVRVTG
jgi:nitrite reductase/ring-hydroxylating ferredoxin subunit